MGTATRLFVETSQKRITTPLSRSLGIWEVRSLGIWEVRRQCRSLGVGAGQQRIELSGGVARVSYPGAKRGAEEG